MYPTQHGQTGLLRVLKSSRARPRSCLTRTIAIHLLDLPPELLAVILSSLNLPALTACLATDRQLKSIIDRSALLQYQIAAQSACVDDNPRDVKKKSAQRLTALRDRERSSAQLLGSVSSCQWMNISWNSLLPCLEKISWPFSLRTWTYLLLACMKSGELELWTIPQDPGHIAAAPEILSQLPRLKHGGEYGIGHVDCSPKGAGTTSETLIRPSFVDAMVMFEVIIEFDGSED